MIETPLGHLNFYIDGNPIDCEVNEIENDKSCAKLSGRYYVVIHFEPDGKRHCISCCIDEYTPSEKDDILIGGYSATYDQKKVVTNNGNPFVYATYANPVPGMSGAVYVILYGSNEDRAGINEAFEHMLTSAEQLPGTSDFQNE